MWLSTFLSILFPLLLAAVIGFFSGRWWTKRWYEDVTESFETLRATARRPEPKDSLTKADLDDRIASLSSSVASIPRTDLDPVTRRLSQIESTVAGLTFPETDLTPVYERMTRIDQRLAQPNGEFDRIEERLVSLESSLGEMSHDLAALHNTDLEPLESRFSALERSISQIDISVPETDLGPVHSGLARLESRFSTLERSISQIDISVPETDLGPVHSGLAQLESRFSTLERSISQIDISVPETDLGPVHSGLAQLELAVSEIDLPQMDLSPLQEQLTGLEMRVVELAEAIEASGSEEFATLSTELGSLSSSFATMNMPNLDPVEARLSGVERAVENIELPKTDLTPLLARIGQLERRLLEPSADYQTLFARLAGMEAAVDALDRDPVDLSPLSNRLSALEAMIAAVRTDVHGIPRLEPVERKLASLQQTILSIPQPDLTPVVTSVRAVESRIDMAAVENRLTAIEYGLTAVHHMLRSRQNGPAPVSKIEPELYSEGAQPVTQPRAPAPATTQTVTTRTYMVSTGGDPLASVRRPNDESNLLTSAAFGEPDDLERISGVGPMLSDLLQNVGVYYFWQIAEWDADDIVWVDNKLEHFKGRIERDNWVGQAREFAAEPGTANRPG